MYVGSAIIGRMPNRFHKHLFKLNGSKLVAAAVAKYGLVNFAFVVADITPSVVTQEDNKAILAIKDHYIQLYFQSTTSLHKLGTLSVLCIRKKQSKRCELTIHQNDENKLVI